MNNWHYARDGAQHGPISAKQLQGLATTGQLSPDDLVWREDTTDWRKASTVKGLFPQAHPSVAAPTPSSPPQLPKPGQAPTDVSPIAINLESTASPFRFAWSEWNFGGKVIFVSASIALVSMLMKWVDVGIASANGFSTGAFALLAFFAYPVWKLLIQKPIHLYGGIGSAAGGMLCVLAYMSEKTVTFGDRSVSVFGAGAVFFFLACGALAFGIYKYQEQI